MTGLGAGKEALGADAGQRDEGTQLPRTGNPQEERGGSRFFGLGSDLLP
jgi:hypothetical protein